jgi:hypothetical protein
VTLDPARRARLREQLARTGRWYVIGSGVFDEDGEIVAECAPLSIHSHERCHAHADLIAALRNEAEAMLDALDDVDRRVEALDRVHAMQLGAWSDAFDEQARLLADIRATIIAGTDATMAVLRIDALLGDRDGQG